MKSERTTPLVLLNSSTRRRWISGVAFVLGGLASSKVLGQMQQTAAKDMATTASNQARTSLHQVVSFKATAQRLYEILLNSKDFAAFTGMAAEIDSKPGGAFSTFSGMIVGRNVELVADQRIVQAWRPTRWDPGVYSIVKFELKPQGPETVVTLDHTGFPEGEYDHLFPGWKLRYWDPLTKFLASTGAGLK